MLTAHFSNLPTVATCTQSSDDRGHADFFRNTLRQASHLRQRTQRPRHRVALLAISNQFPFGIPIAKSLLHRCSRSFELQRIAAGCLCYLTKGIGFGHEYFSEIRADY
jgi:hypothetical protein